ncbi:MAG: Lrp/AsnC family transcriptional regulator [Oceanospirillaceae bacterium]
MFLDKLDKTILRQLQDDASMSNLALSHLVGLSPPACLKRVKRLEREGVISARVALLNPQKLGPCLHMIIEVRMERDRAELNRHFIKLVKNAKEVKECYKVTGEVDFVLVVTVSDMQAYEEFCQRVIYSDANMKNFRTLISINRTKYITSVLIED